MIANVSSNINAVRDLLWRQPTFLTPTMHECVSRTDSRRVVATWVSFNIKTVFQFMHSRSIRIIRNSYIAIQSDCSNRVMLTALLEYIDLLEW